MLLLAAMSAGAVPCRAAPQRLTLASKSYTDSQTGFRVKHPGDWRVTPLQPQRRAAGVVFQMEAPDSGPRWGEMNAIRLDPEEGDGGTSTRPRIEQLLGEPPFSYRDFESREVDVDESLRIDGLATHHLRWAVGVAWIDTWTIHLQDFDLCFLYTVHAEDKYADGWLKLFAKSARSFSEVERTEQPQLEQAESYADVLAYYSWETEHTPGWRALPTPTEDFVIKTDSDNDRFIDAVIERLERSREVFEQDFPPPGDFDHVSVVRVCDSEEEFHHYGGTSGGVAGWFNSATDELVLFDAVAIDRKVSFAVMSHEAFHQYCYFLFGRSEAHRWFDEGLGDYYGGLKFQGRKTIVTARMPAGLERYSGIRTMIREGTYAPLAQHLNFDHAQWQGQGPRNVSPYEESWSIIYMLRQGALGNVPRKLWKDEYAEILPNYIRVLNDEFRTAYAEQVDLAWQDAGEEGREPTEEELRKAGSEVSEERKQEIWKRAMDASWGRIDLDEFEHDWLEYVPKYLRD